MGAWDTGNFQNDLALDWISQFEENPSIILIERTIGNLFKKEYLDLDDSWAALAALEVVAWVKGSPSKDFPDLDKVDKMSLLFYFNTDFNEKCVLALNIILREENNELLELWQETDYYNNWVEVVENLQRRVST